MENILKFYKENNISKDDQVQNLKNILLVVPERRHDISVVLSSLGVDRAEVALTWKKDGIELFNEIPLLDAKLVLQVDCQLVKRYPVVLSSDPSSILKYKPLIPNITPDGFVGLHHHDEFSIKDGLGTAVNLVELLQKQRRSFCCITNHGSLGGWIKQYNACKKSGVKAIFGMEAYYSNYRGDDPDLRKAHRSANHLVLIAKTEEGFYNIIKIHNDAQLNGFYYTPRVDRKALKEWGKGIIASTACMSGIVPKHLMNDEYDKAREVLDFYKSCFDEFYIEIQIIEMEAQKEANRRLIKLARETNTPLLLTCDSHYLDSEHSEAHDLLMLMRQNKTIVDKKERDDVWSFDVKNLFYRNSDTMRLVFENGWTNESGYHEPFKDDVFTEEVFSEAMSNSLKIARSTEIMTLDSQIKLPKLYEDGDSVLRDKVNRGFTKLGLGKRSDRDVYIDRINYEYEIITRLGWSDYFLVMDRIISSAKDKFGDWACGFGRGSACGSLISYCLGLTGIDPIEYGLLFERFLDESRGGVRACAFEL